MRRTNSTSSALRHHRRVVKPVLRTALLDRPHVMPGRFPAFTCPAGLGKPEIKLPFLQ